jgi:secreted trypsin-like serine protease
MNAGVLFQDRIKEKLPDLFPNHVLCAGTDVGTQGSCKGDSGGPLLSNDWETKKWIQFAIVQGAVRDCGDSEYPGIYTRLEDPAIFSFISSVLGITRKSTKMETNDHYSTPLVQPKI